MANLESELVSGQKLRRDRALEALALELKAGTCDPALLDRLPNPDPEAELGCLIGTLNALQLLVKHDFPLADDKIQQTETSARNLLSHTESRVRTAAGSLLAALAVRCEPAVWSRTRAHLLSLLRDNLERQESSEAASLSAKLSSDVFHDTAGWNALETTLNTLLAFARALGPGFAKELDEEVIGLLDGCLAHTNRFVRESGYHLLAELLRFKLDENQFAHALTWLRKGLTDNWSQVRMAASTAARVLVDEGSVENMSADQQALIIPPLCLNRFYLAQGVQIYSQETWRRLRQSDVDYVVLHLAAICDFYVEQSTADNHAVREAAAQAIAELGAKVDPTVLRPLAPTLVHALLRSFADDSWPVRDAACLATAGFLSVMPEIALDVAEGSPLAIRSGLLPKFWPQLTDCIPSVRQGAAESIAVVAKAYTGKDDRVIEDIMTWLTSHISMAKEQPVEELASSGLSSAPAQFGVARTLRANDMDLHSNQTMYSCGSLAPKMKAGGGCSDSCFQRPSQPWEETDGALRLLARLSAALPKMATRLSPIVPEAIEATALEHYVSHVRLKETFCLQVPVLSKGLGKRELKEHLEEILIRVVKPSLNSDCRLTEVAAEECLLSLGNFLGQTILRIRIENLGNHGRPLLDRYNQLKACSPVADAHLTSLFQ